jgi:hypothetical protein
MGMGMGWAHKSKKYVEEYMYLSIPIVVLGRYFRHIVGD